MRLLTSLRSFASNLFHRSHVESEMHEELRAHIQNRADDLERSGVPRGEAERRARIEFGGPERFKEEIRETMGTRFLESLFQNIRFGLRMLRKSPGFTAASILTLALGVGANTAIFTVVYATLLRPLPYAQPNSLIAITEVRRQEQKADDSDFPFWDASNPDYLDWKQQSRSFQALAAFSGDGFTLRGVGEPRTVLAVQSTINFLSTLGVRPILGRDFADGEDVASGPTAAIVTYGFWQSQLGADPNVIGRSIVLDSSSVRIIGVLPREFEFAPRGGAEIWVPFHLDKDQASRRSLRWMRVIGRLAPGATLEQARTEMSTINVRLAAAYPQANAKIRVAMTPLRNRIVGQVRPLLLILFGAAGFVLLIACANVASLLMVRATGRRREFAIRTALGASRGRLILQLLAESLMLAAAGAALGLLFAQWGTSMLIAGIPKAQAASLPFLGDAHTSPAVLAFLCIAAIFTGVAFGLAPALQVTSRQGVGDALKEEARGSAGSARTRLRNALVVVEIAVSLVLLVGAGLMVKSLSALLHRNPGFDAQNLLTFSVFLPPTSYPKDPDAIRFDRELAERVRVLPGVMGVANNSIVPLTGGGGTIRFLIEGQPMAPGQEYESASRDVSSGYFSLMKIPLVAGRFFDDSADSPTAPQHVIVNQAWVKQYVRGESPLGKRIRFTFSPKETYREIVGVTGNVADAGLDKPEEPALFLPFTQDAGNFITYIVRTAGDPDGAIGAVRTALHETDAQLVLIRPLTMDQIIAQSPSVFLRRYPSYLIGSFAALALILAVVGLYGLISYSVSQRTREIGIRIALGAERGDVLRLVLGEGARLALAGIAIGVVAALGLTQLMRSLLFGVSTFDPITFGLVAIALAVVTVAACYVPARRAMRVDPMVALRYE
jgi:predicted permease